MRMITQIIVLLENPSVVMLPVMSGTASKVRVDHNTRVNKFKD